MFVIIEIDKITSKYIYRLILEKGSLIFEGHQQFQRISKINMINRLYLEKE